MEGWKTGDLGVGDSRFQPTRVVIRRGISLVRDFLSPSLFAQLILQVGGGCQ